MTRTLFLLLIAGFIHSTAYAATAVTGSNTNTAPVLSLFKKHCASCHGENRLGLVGPPLIPQSFKRLKPEAAALVIKNGRAATQMPAFGETLSKQQISPLVDYIYTKPEQMPVWDMACLLYTSPSPRDY